MRNGIRGSFGVAHPEYPDAVGNEIIANIVGIKLAFIPLNEGQKTGWLRRLIPFVNTSLNQGETIAERAQLIARFNTLFRKKIVNEDYDDPFANVINFTKKMLWDVVTEIHNLGHNVAPEFTHYCQQVVNAHETVFNMREVLALNGIPATSIYQIIHTFRQNNLGYGDLCETNVIEVHKMMAKAPPAGGFGGLVAWGPGNYHTVNENKKGHFLKHVLNADPQGKDLNWNDEMRRWWVQLNIQVTLATLNQHMPGNALVLANAGRFVDNNTPLAMNEVVPLMNALHGQMSDAFKDHMYTTYGAAYEQIALNIGLNLISPAVCSDAAHQKISISGRDNGGYQGDVFVVGRIKNGVLGISSCYFAEDINERLDRLVLWQL